MMNMGYKLIALVCLAAGSLAGQTSEFDKPPAGTEEALRERVTKYYQAFVSGKFRVADQVVAEESKDDFFAIDKSKYRGFNIQTITWEENFTKARVLTMVDTDWFMMGRTIQAKAPQLSLWKLEKGEWFWYIKSREVVFPFARHPVPEGGGNGPDAPPGGVRVPKVLLAVTPEQVVLDPSKGCEAVVTLQNMMPGQITLRAEAPNREGVTMHLEPKTLESQGTARLSFTCDAARLKIRDPFQVRVVVLPAELVFPVGVTFLSKKK
jgi:hypothetical protein